MIVHNNWSRKGNNQGKNITLTKIYDYKSISTEKTIPFPVRKTAGGDSTALATETG